MTSNTGYREIFRNPSFRAFWLAFTFSALGDGLTRVALTWFVYEQTGSAAALGWLNVAYTAPVILGGLAAGMLLDRFDRRKVMFVDNLLRAAAMGMLPLLHVLGVLELWHIYAAAAVYGSLMMISLAGGPALVPMLVKDEQLSTANALEMLSWTLASVIGPPLAGVLIARIGGPEVIVIDALSYLAFALVLIGLKVRSEHHEADHDAAGQPAPRSSYSMGDAVRLMLGSPVLLSTTLMFLTYNIGMGLLNVWLPIYVDVGLGGGAELYGLLLGALAVGEIAASLAVGTIRLPVSLGKAIAGAQTLAGMSLAIMLFIPALAATALSFALVGLFSAPLTIWAQTLRMQIIPDHLRGRTFALLRLLMQGSSPLGSAAAGALLPLTGITLLVGISALLMGGPGVLGALVPALRSAGAPAPALAEAPVSAD